MKTKKKSEISSKNKKAFFNYEILEELECGMALLGSEVKSIRDGHYSFTDSFVEIDNGQLILKNFTIQPYSNTGAFSHNPERKKVLLAKKDEIKKLKRKVEAKGFTLVPTYIYEKNNLIKMKIGLARGKNAQSKKETIKNRDIARDAERQIRDYKKFKN